MWWKNVKGIDIQYGTSNIAHNIIKYNSIYSNTNCGIVVNGECNNIQYNDITNNENGLQSNTGTTCNFNIVKNNDLSSNTASNLKLGSSGSNNVYVNNDGVSSEPKLLISNSGKGYINEIYIDNSTNQLCWNKDGSIKKVQLT